MAGSRLLDFPLGAHKDGTTLDSLHPDRMDPAGFEAHVFSAI
jgi:hypothetical protein